MSLNNNTDDDDRPIQQPLLIQQSDSDAASSSPSIEAVDATPSRGGRSADARAAAATPRDDTAAVQFSGGGGGEEMTPHDGDSGDMSASPPKKAVAAKRAIRVAQVLTSGSFLPLFTDKVRNNVRSRSMLIGIYAVSTAFVCLLLVYAISINTSNAWVARFATRPPSKAYIGEPMSTFSFEVVDANNEGVSGLHVFAFISPITDVDLTVTLDQGSTISRTLQCIKALSLVASTSINDDIAFCDPSSYGMVSESFGVTDARGLAKFGNFILGFGVVGPYVLTVGLIEYPDIFDTQFISVVSNVQGIEVDQPIRGFLDYQGATAFIVPIVDATNYDEYAQDVSVTVSFIPSLRFQASYNRDDAEAAAAQAAAFLGISIPDYVTMIAEQYEPMVPLVCGAIVSLDMQKSGYTDVNAVIQPLEGTPRKGMQFVNNIACNASVVPGNRTLTASGLSQVFYVTLTFKKFAVTGTNTKQMFFGVSAMGLTVPLPVWPLSTPSQTPSQLLVAASPFTPVAVVTASCPTCETAGWSLVEGVAIGNLAVKVTAASGAPLVNKTVYLYTRASSILNPVADGTEANYVPTINAKQMMFETAVTDANGIAVLPNARFTCTGAPGVYDLYAVCDGVLANWSITSNSSSSNSGQQYQSFHVASTVGMVLFQFTGGSQKQVEFVGTPWKILPIFLVATPEGDAGIPGKSVDIVASAQDVFATTTQALTTNDEGVSLVVSVVVHTTNATVAMLQSMEPQRVLFNIVVDGMVFGQFERWIAPPRNFTWVVAPPPTASDAEFLDDGDAAGKHSSSSATAFSTNDNYTFDGDTNDGAVAQHGVCSYLRVLSRPSLGYFGLPYILTVRAEDAMGNAVPYALFALFVDTKYISPPPNTERYELNVTVGPDGIAYVSISIDLVPSEFSLVGGMFCYSRPEVVNYVAMNFVGRITTVELTFIGSGILCVHLGVRDPILINETFPVLVTAVPLWYPSYVVNFLTPALFPQPSVAAVTSVAEAQHVCITMSNETALTYPTGMYAFFIAVDANYMNPMVITDLQNENVTLEVNRSMFAAPVDVLHVGIALPNQPIVRATSTSTGLPLQNLSIFLQVALVDPNTNERTYQDVYTNVASLSMGGFTVFNTSAGEPIRKPIATPTDANGLGYFYDLMLGGAPSGVPISVRYCLSVDAQVDLNLNVSNSRCVDDPYVGIVPIQETIRFTTTGQSSIGGAPSQPLPPITITGVLNDGRSPPGMLCAPMLVSAPRDFLVFSSNFYTRFDAYGTFKAVGGTMEIINSISISSVMPEGNYGLYFVCSGGVTPPMALIVSSTPARMSFTTPPPPLHQPANVTQIIPIGVELLSQSANPIAYQDVELQLQSTTAVVNCTGKACGYLDGSSILYATTDINGNALFTVIFTAGSTSHFNVQLRIASALSDTGIRQAAKLQLQAMGAMYGTPVVYLIPVLIQKIPTLAALLRVSSATAKIGSQTSGTLINGGGIAVGAASSASHDSPSGGASSGAGGAPAASYENPLERLIGMFQDVLGTSSGGPGSSVTLTSELSLFNPVVRGVILRPERIPDELELPLNVQAIVAISGMTSTVSSTVSGGNAPIVQFFDATGLPVSNASVIIEVLPIGNQGCTISYENNNFFTDANGTVTLSPFTLTGSLVGTYQLRFTAFGGGAVASKAFQVTQVPPISRTEYMKYLAVFLVCFFSPMLMASVPHSRKAYMPVACVVVCAAVAATVVLREYIPQDQVLYRGYFYFLLSLTCLVAVGTIALAVVDALGYACKKYHLRLANDELKALQVLRYTTWIVNIRIRHQSEMWEALQTEQQASTGNRLKLFKYQQYRKAIDEINKVAGSDVLDDSRVAMKQRQRLRRVAQTALIYTPSESFDPVYIPINFLIVIGISLVLLVTLCFIIVFIYDYVLQKINVFVSYLPSTTGADAGTILIVNKMLILSITSTVDIIVRMFPQFAHLSTINSAIENIDLLQLLGTIRTYVSEGLLRLQIAFWVGGSVALIAFVATVALTGASIPTTIRRIRRGQLDIPTAIPATEAYIGMHCLQLIIMHQIVFWPVAVIVFVLSVGPIRVFLWDKLSVIIVASIASTIVQMLIQGVLVAKFLSNGKWTVLRPEFYSVWHFAGLILGVFSGIVKSGVRWGMSLGLVSALFARLDQAIFPQLFASMDKGHSGFMSVVAIEAKNGNPIYITVATVLLLDRKLLQLAAAAQEDEGGSAAAGSASAEPDAIEMCAQNGRSPQKQADDATAAAWQPTKHPLLRLPVDDTMFSADHDLSAVVKNCARILLRRDAVPPPPDTTTKAGGASSSSYEWDLRQPPCKPAAAGDAVPQAAASEPLMMPQSSTSTSTSLLWFDLQPYANRQQWFRSQRIRQRFWLWYLLSVNPVLISDRKHNLYYSNDHQTDESGAASEGGAVEGGEERDAVNMAARNETV